MTEGRASKPAGSLIEGKRVLLVEDDADIRRMITIVLQTGGAVVEEASCAGDAQRLLESKAIDAVVTDWNILGSTGEAFLTGLSQSHPSVFARTLVVTGQLVRSRQHAAGLLGRPLLTKPFRPRELVEALSRLFE